MTLAIGYTQRTDKLDILHIRHSHRAPVGNGL